MCWLARSDLDCLLEYNGSCSDEVAVVLLGDQIEIIGRSWPTVQLVRAS